MEPEWFTFCDPLPSGRAVGMARARHAIRDLAYRYVPAFRSDLIMVAKIP
jgi:hypothetical protein